MKENSKRNCSTHNQKLARYPNTKANKHGANVGVQNKKGSRNKIRRKTKTRSPIPAPQQPRKERLPNKPKTTTSRKNKKSIHHNKKGKNTEKHTKRTNTKTCINY